MQGAGRPLGGATLIWRLSQLICRSLYLVSWQSFDFGALANLFSRAKSSVAPQTDCRIDNLSGPRVFYEDSRLGVSSRCISGFKMAATARAELFCQSIFSREVGVWRNNTYTYYSPSQPFSALIDEKLTVLWAINFRLALANQDSASTMSFPDFVEYFWGKEQIKILVLQQ